MLEGKKILVGVTGSVAASKVPALILKLENLGALVSVLTTESARDFLEKDQYAHINLGKEYDLILIAPCTANTLSKLANGICDNLLTQTVLAATCPVMIAPAMNFKMLNNPVIQNNLSTLKKSSYKVLRTDTGKLACGEKGDGRLLNLDELIIEIRNVFVERDLVGKRILITGGATREAIDPVRYISNHSSGKMALTLVNVALARGATVVYIKGRTDVQDIPSNVKMVEVETALEMFDAVLKELPMSDVFISTAAVCDFRPTRAPDHKIKGVLEVSFVKNPDILAEIPKLNGKIYIGFALETDNEVKNAQKKLNDKGLDLIIANTPDTFGSDMIKPIMISKDRVRHLGTLQKTVFAGCLFDAIF